MYHNWNPHDPTHSLSNNSRHHRRYRLMENQNTRSARFWILKWTDTADQTIDYTTWYIGQVTKVPMRKLHGYQHETSPIHLNSTSYSTNDTLISWAPRIAEREFPTTRCIAARPLQGFFFLPFFLLVLSSSFFLSYFLSCPFLSVSPSEMFPFLSFPFLLLKCFPFFIHSILNFPWLNFSLSPHTILQTSHPHYSC